MFHPIRHFITITKHRNEVIRLCIKAGIGLQGLFHDLSKYSPTEFIPGAKYYTGKESPNNGERRETGYSLAWMHHKGRNKHHFEYWIDYLINEDGTVGFGGNKMPKRYVAEMFCDRVAACKIYKGDKYTDADAHDYLIRAKKWTMMHPDTFAAIEKMLRVLKEEGEDAAFAYVRRWLNDDSY
jgi:hypothetical protein